VIGFRSEVSRFYENLSQVYEKDNFDATRIFNVDETGMSTVQQQKQKILAPSGKKQVGKLVSAEKVKQSLRLYVRVLVVYLFRHC